MVESVEGIVPRAAVLERRPPSWLRQVLIVFEKDLRIEAQTGEVVTTSCFFALLVVITASLSFYGGPSTGRLVAAGVIWLSVAFATVLSLGRTWQREREGSALDGLVVSPISPSALFTGKALGVAVFIGLVECVVIPVAALFFSLDLADHGPGLLLIALCATPGLAATGTLFGAMTVRTRARDLTLAVVLLPLLFPTLLSAVVATRELFNQAPLGELSAYFQLMGVFDVTFVAGGLAMFGPLTEA